MGLCGHAEALPYVIPAFAGIHYEEAEAVGGDRLLSRAVGICPDFILGGDPLTVKIYEIETDRNVVFGARRTCVSVARKAG